MTPIKTEDLMKVKAGDKVRVYSTFCFENGISAYDGEVKHIFTLVEPNCEVRLIVIKGNGKWKDDYRSSDHSVYLHEIYGVETK